MGGTSKQTQTTSSKTEPWAQAVPAMQGILGQLQPLIDNSGLSPTSTNALNQLQTSASAGNPFSTAITDYTKNLLNGGGANDQAGAMQGGMDTLRQQLSPFASPDYSSLNDPKLRAALDQIQSDVGNSINSQFAAAGRDMSGANQMAYGRGVSAAQAPLILDQFNKDRAMQQGAAGALYNAQNSTSGLLSGLNQQSLANQGQGVTASQDALAAQNYAPTQTLAIEQLRQMMPAQNLGLLAQIGIPIAGLGGTSNSTSTGTNQMSGAQQLGSIVGSVGNLFGGLGAGDGGSNVGFSRFLFGRGY